MIVEDYNLLQSIRNLYMQVVEWDHIMWWTSAFLDYYLQKYKKNTRPLYAELIQALAENVCWSIPPLWQYILIQTRTMVPMAMSAFIFS